MKKIDKEDIKLIFEKIEDSKVPFSVNWLTIEKYGDDIAKIINDVIMEKF